MRSKRRYNKCEFSGIVFGFDNMTHKNGIAGIGDDEKEEWMVRLERTRPAAWNVFTANCGHRLGSFLVNLKGEESPILWKCSVSPTGASFRKSTNCHKGWEFQFT